MSNNLNLPINTLADNLSNHPINAVIQQGEALIQQGEKNTIIQNAAQVIINNPPHSIPILRCPLSLHKDCDYYNLIVNPTIDFESPSTPFEIHPSRALTEYVEDNIKQQFATLEESTIDSIRQFPTIFVHENENYGSANPAQYGGIGYIKTIHIHPESIVITPVIEHLFLQQILNEHRLQFDIVGTDTFNELNRTHWSIKKVNLLFELHALGVRF